ncbi:hypothetical protein Cgig2_010782 [Carnegiea gigantea]|uniref:Aminotransferase-like plant mobile domain-containing protein n=1 Tax=Carnegiea gigantea TaxID=171969 RepID=A0A9Q1GLT0_9CARY|nr:hypothetical protein Cgig2_010782 [Carnegiea gigantea]
MLSRNHVRNFYSRVSFLTHLSIRNGRRMSSPVVYWCPQTNCLHTLKGEISISLLDIHGFLGLLWSDFLYDEVVPPSKELKTSLGRSYTHLLTTYHIHRQRFDHNLTIEEWIAFWFRGPVRYHAPMKLDRRSQAHLPIYVSLTTKVHGWNESHAAFDELGMPKGEQTETFLTAFLLCWLCLFLFPVKDAGCIHPGTFSVASSMERGQAYCLSLAILASIYRALGKIYRFTHLGRKGAKYFWTYDFNGNAKTFDLDGASELISSARGFYWNSDIRHRIKETLIDNGQLLPADFAYFASICSSYVYCRCEDIFVIEHYCFYRVCFDSIKHAYTMKQILKCISWSMPFYGDKVHSRFQAWWSKVFLTSSGTYSRRNSKRKRDSPSGSKPKVKIVRSQKPLRSHVLKTEGNTPQRKIPGVAVAMSVTFISIIHIQSIVTLTKTPYEVRLTPEPSHVTACRRKLNKLNYGKTIFLPLDGAENIKDILDWDSSPIECMGESGAMNFKEKLAHVFCTPFERLYYLKGKFISLYDLINERGGEATPFKNKVDRLIHQARDLKDL